MGNTLKIIGAFVVAIISYAIPILTVVSFLYDWHELLKGVLIIVSLGEIAYVVLTLLEDE